MKKMFILGGIAAVGAFFASAAEYTVSVASGEKNLAAALAAAYPSGVTLVAGDTVVKTGAGLLVDTEAATDGSAIRLTFDIREGAFSETVARAGSTYKVTSGAACVLRTDPYALAPTGNRAQFVLAGSGTGEWPGALCFCSEADSWNTHYAEYKLTDDAVIHSLNDTSMIFGGASVDMQGHRLTFQAPASNDKAYFRIRQAMTFKNPGAIEIDSVGFSSLSSVPITVSGADKIPLLKLTNGARLGCGANFAERFATAEFAAGTQLCKVYDTPGSYALDKVIGCPTISAEQTVTVGGIVARTDDLLAGHRLSAANSLVLAEGATLAVVGILNGLQSQAYAVAEVTGASAALSGSATSADPYFTASSTETAIALTPTTAALAETAKGVCIDVATGEGLSLGDVDLGTETSGKSLRKVGGGVLRGVDVSDFGLREVVVAAGSYVVTGLNQIPLESKKRNLTVLSGATARFEAPFIMSATSVNEIFACSVAGAGVDGKGALVFSGKSVLGADSMCVTWTLTDDATIGFEEGDMCVYHFSNRASGVDDYNLFNMNGHVLSLKNATGTDTSKCIVRVRLSIQFGDPGEIILDGLAFTHGNAAWNVLVKDAAGADALLPRIRLTNGAVLNVHDQTFADKIACVEAEPGTTLGAAYDTPPSDYALAQLAGCPSVTSDQTVTINGLTVRTDDLLAGRRLSTANVVFAAETPLRVVGALVGLTAGTSYPVVEGAVSGSLSWSGTDDFTFSADDLALSPTAELIGKAGDGWGVYVSAGATESRPTATSAPAETSGKTLVKLGGGSFAPVAGLVDAGYAAISVAEGSYGVMANDRLPIVANAMRVTVAEGATLRFGGSFRMETATAPDNITRRLVVTAAGSGADGQGAVVFAKPMALGAGNQAARWTLTGDAVFGFASVTQTSSQEDRTYQISSFSASDKDNNVFDLAGHVLTLRGLETAKVRPNVRLRYSCNVKRPGALVIDNLGFMHGNKSWEFNVTDGAGAPCCLPVRLVNGSVLNVHDQTFADAIASVEAEAGTSFATVYDAPSEAVTLAAIAGCPTVAADQAITVRRLVADAADLVAGRKLTAEGTFGFAEGAVVAVNGYSSLTAGTAYPAAAAQKLTGTAAPALALLYSVVKDGDVLSVAPLAQTDEFVVDVPAGETLDWATVTAGRDPSEWADKRLVKAGLGTLALSEGESVADIGLTELVVAEGLYEITKKGQIPVFDGEQKLTVMNGATARFGCSIGILAGAEDVLVCTAEGSGSAGGNGALVFRDGAYLAMEDQYAHWHLSGDAVYGFEQANQANFSGQNGKMTYNDFHMNGHSLTLRCLAENKKMEGNVRIRLGISFYQPGDIILDNIGLTHGNASWAVDVKDENGDDTVLPCIRLVKGSYLNVHDQTFADKIGRVDAAVGTVIGKVYDTPELSYRLAEIAGTPWITSEQAVTIVKKLVVCRADVDTGNCIATDGTLAFAPGCRLEIDDATGLTEKSNVCFARAKLGGISGRARPVNQPFNTRVDGSDGYDCLKPGPFLGTMIMVR